MLSGRRSGASNVNEEDVPPVILQVSRVAVLGALGLFAVLFAWMSGTLDRHPCLQNIRNPPVDSWYFDPGDPGPGV
jgi:hypothetical protein